MNGGTRKNCPTMDFRRAFDGSYPHVDDESVMLMGSSPFFSRTLPTHDDNECHLLEYVLC